MRDETFARLEALGFSSADAVVLADPDSEPARTIVAIADTIDSSRGAGFTRTLPLVS